MTTASPIPASLAAACAAHDRHRLDVLDALLDEAAPSAVRELLGAALDLCASLRADRDTLAAKLDAAPKVCAIHSYEHGPGPCMTCGAWPPGTRELIAACQTRIAGLEQAADERSKEVARLTDRVAELEARPVLTEERLRGALFACADGASDAEVRAILAKLGPVTLPAQDRAEELLLAFIDHHGGLLDRSINGEESIGDVRVVAMSRALASLGAPPTSPPAARPVFAGVTVEELGSIYSTASGCCCPAVDRHGAEAVLARLKVTLVAPVDPEQIAADITGPIGDRVRTGEWKRIKDAARATLTAAGIPVTPEVGK